MQDDRLDTISRQLLDLMERSEAALDARDLAGLEAVAEETGAVAARLDRLRLAVEALQPGEAGPAVPAVPRLAEALARWRKIQAELEGWKEETRRALCQASEGSAALAGYAALAGPEPARVRASA